MILLIYKIRKKPKLGFFLILSVYRYDLCSKLSVVIAEETAKNMEYDIIDLQNKKKVGFFLILSVYRYDLCSKLKLLNSHSSFIECTKMHLFSPCNHVKTRRTLYVKKLFYNSRKRITETTILCQHT
ncbi:hypothetical protein DN395_23780 [Bacillus sp. AR18-7]|nr:hypothetical protein DN395_23780 [Bacillus sp. AR18-7]